MLAEPKHVAHVELHVAHVPSPSTSYLPSAQVEVHVPATESKLPPGRQAVQPAAVASVHSAQLASHATQLELESAKVLDGQAATHEPDAK